MACKCGDTNIDSHYKCNACHIVDSTFKWCVITKASDTEDGNHYDEILDLMTTNVTLYKGASTGKVSSKATVQELKGTPGMVCFKRPVFKQGEVFPIEPDFERELGHGRKASKWDVEYELFNAKDYKKAILRALKASKEATKEVTNLNLLEDIYEKNLERSKKQQKLKASTDPVKTIYDWIRQGHVSLKEVKALIKDREII